MLRKEIRRCYGRGEEIQRRVAWMYDGARQCRIRCECRGAGVGVSAEADADAGAGVKTGFRCGGGRALKRTRRRTQARTQRWVQARTQRWAQARTQA